jgi:hypothetical protein
VPVIMTTDVKFLKNILIKDFNSFVNRRVNLTLKYLFGKFNKMFYFKMCLEKKVFECFMIEPSDKFLTVLKDDEWKNARSILTATFTSGKLKSVIRVFLRVKIYRKIPFSVPGVQKTSTRF